MIASLPESYNDLHLLPSPSPSSDHEASARYRELLSRLTALAARRDVETSKFARYKQLQTLLEPFTNPQENIQPNLVTRDGELGKELEKMRVLLARVTGRIGEMKEKDGVQGEGKRQAKGAGSTLSNEEKLRDVMDLT